MTFICVLGCSLQFLYSADAYSLLRRYKYIVAVDGFTAPTSRIAHLLYSGSAVFKQESPFQEFW